MGDRHGEKGTVGIKKIPRHGGIYAQAVSHSQSWRKGKQSHHTFMVSARGGFGCTEQGSVPWDCSPMGVWDSSLMGVWGTSTQSWENLPMKKCI